MRTKLTTAIITLLAAIQWLTLAFAENAGEARLPQLISAGPVIVNLPLEASPFTGEAYTSVPIDTLPAAGDIQKKISLELQYRSSGSNSWIGKGWDLEPGYIARVNKYGAGQANNPYLLVLNGNAYELINIGGSQYRAKHETYMKIESYGTSWKVWEKDGTQYIFDLSIGSRWVLTRITDTHNISAVFSYDYPSGEEIYLREIRYPDTPGLTAYCKISFISEDRPDKLISYYYGSAYRMNRRLKEIQVLSEGYLQKRYVLSYTTNGTGNISFLSSLTQYGKDGRALPATSFLYQQPLSSNILQGSQEWLPNKETFTHETGYDGAMGYVPGKLNMAFIDMNGDNLPDLVGCKMNPDRKYYWVVHFNTGNGFSPTASLWLDAEKSFYPFYFGGVTFYYSITLQRATLLDMNRDGLPDLVYSKNAGKIYWHGTGFGAPDLIVRFNTGSGFSDTETKLLDYNDSWFPSYDDKMLTILRLGETALLADMNGDGLPDLVYHKLRAWESWGGLQYGVSDWVVRLNTGSGFSTQEQVWLSYDKAFFKYQVPLDPYGSTYKLEPINIIRNATLADMNGDGLLDLVYNDFGSAVAASQSPYLGQELSAIYYNWKVRYNTGSRFSDEAVTLYANAPAYFYQEYSYYARAASVKIGDNGTLADINGDGLLDLVFNEYQQDSPDHPSMPFKVCFNIADRFSSPVSLTGTLGHFLGTTQTFANVKTFNVDFIDVNKDGAADFVYPYFLGWQYGNAEFTAKVLPNNGSVATDLLTRHISPYGGSTAISYTSSAFFDNTGGDGKNDLPFAMPLATSTVKNPGVGISGNTSYQYEGGWYDILNREFRGFRHVQITDPLNYLSHTYFHQDDSRLGKVERQENSIARTVNTYQQDNSPPYFTPLIQVDEYTDSKYRRAAYEYDIYGNVSKTIDYGDGDLTGDEKTVLMDYSVNTSSWLVNLPSRGRIFANADGSGLPVAEALYYYDNNPNYTDIPVKGDLTTVKTYLNTTTEYIITASSYDVYGNAITRTDANGNTTAIEYDSTYHTFPITVTNPKGHIERVTYYMPLDTKGLFGQVKSKIDFNGNETTLEYDGFGRKIKVIGPYDLYSTYGAESYEYSINGPGSNCILTRTTEESGTSNHFIKADILDGFERIIQTSKESESADIYNYMANTYNPRGELSMASLPYFKDGGLRMNYLPADGSVKWTQSAFDAIGRITSITKADGGVVNNYYNGWTTTLVDENGHQKTYIKDAYGRLVSVKEKNGVEEYITNYKYDSQDNLVLITDHLGNKFEFTYDSLKRKIKTVDPDLGTWDYGYDKNGNLIMAINAEGKTINFAYDELNRVTSKDYAVQPGIEVIYKYDELNSANGINRRTGMQDLSGDSRWDYDKKGRVTKSEKTIDGNTYTSEWTYDAMDRIKSILFPNLRKVDFIYNNAGLAESIEGFVLNTDYNAAYQPVTVVFSNSMAGRFDYYPENYRLKSMLTGSLQSLSYEYDKVGNISKITDAVRSNIKNFNYDDLDRLISGDGNTYGYNAIGNIISFNGVTQNYSISKIHALINDGTNTYSYDACGNMISGAGRSIIYDSENRPVEIAKNGIITQFVYDGDGKRVKKIVNNGRMTTATVYIEDLYEKEITQ